MKEWDAPESNKTEAGVELTRNIPSTTLEFLSLWASIGIVTKLSALETSRGGRIRQCHIPYRCANWALY
jgi:hypothetical protein